MILTKEVEIKPYGKTITHYKNKGYDVKFGEPIIVKTNDLAPNSKHIVLVKCDVCGKEKNIQYHNYHSSIENGGYCCCNECSKPKRTNTIISRYGFDNYSKTDEYKQKIKKISFEKYGCDHMLQSSEIRQKINQTVKERYGVNNPMQNPNIYAYAKQQMLEKYGIENPMESEIFRQKIKDTTYKHYGVYNAMKHSDVKEKARQTSIKHFGVDHPMKSLEMRERVTKTTYSNGTCPTSKQQKHLHEVVGGEINYPISRYSADICFPDEKLCVEYDGGGHNLQVKFGEVSQTEFNNKEIIRNNVIKHEGYKQIHLISSTDKLPSDEILLQILELSRKYFSDFPEHSWINFDIDASIVRNAEQKDGVFFDYGDLRRIA